MSIILYLIAISLVLGLCALGLFMWSLRAGQFDDLEGAARRVLFDDLDEAARSQEAVPTRPVAASK